jgi:tRNA(adenine34) deaminase
MDKHENFMMAALDEARQALIADEFPVGCVMVHEGQIITSGRRINSKGPAENELDHAEVVALRKLFSLHPETDRHEIVVYSTMEPCLMCYVTLLLNGIRKIVYGFEDIMGGGTNLDLQQLNLLYREMEVEVIPHVMRSESLALFNEFFENPGNTYWQDSPLAQHILAQSAEGRKS